MSYELTIPRIESPFYRDMFVGKSISTRADLASYATSGYLIVKDLLTPEECDSIILSVREEMQKNSLKKQESGYHYNPEGSRVFEAWKWSQPVLNLARHPRILSILETLYERKPQPFQTINFDLGSDQPLHSDVIHFHSLPHRWVVGVWTALEDMDEDNGTLAYVPDSHKEAIYEFQDIGLPAAKYGEQFESYAKYEQFIRDLVAARKYEVKKFICKKGDALVWAANLIHGGSPIKDPKRTRWSQATHYYFEGCDHYYAPMFSDVKAGIIAEKNLKEKDILNHRIG